LIFVMNKADRVCAREREEARNFCAQVIASRLGRPIGSILEISAADQLAGRGDSGAWNALYSRLNTLADQSATALVLAAEERSLRILTDRALREISERENALQRPTEESTRRIEYLRQCAAEAERALRDLSHLLSAEEDRLGTAFAQLQDAYLERAIPAARTELARLLRDLTGNRAARWRDSNRLAGEVFHRFLGTWRVEQQPRAEAMYRDGINRFTDLVSSFLQRLAASGTISATDLPQSFEPERRFRVASRLFFTELMHWTSRSPFRWLADAFRTRRSFDTAVERHAVEYLERLMTSNASRLTNALAEQVLESRRRLERDLREQLYEVYAVAERALQRAQVQRAAGVESTRAELERLMTLRTAFAHLRSTSVEVH
jgi:hypothetical protein